MTLPSADQKDIATTLLVDDARIVAADITVTAAALVMSIRRHPHVG